VFKLLNRRGGKRKSFTWQVYNRALAKPGIAKPRNTEKPATRRVFV
jgi:RNA-directed DNA polymerase